MPCTYLTPLTALAGVDLERADLAGLAKLAEFAAMYAEHRKWLPWSQALHHSARRLRSMAELQANAALGDR